MSTMVLPGTYIEVRAEGLIAPGQVTVGNVGVVGTASKGPIGKPTLLSNHNDALSIFGSYDAFTQPTVAGSPLSLVRALELLFASGASTVYAVRVADTNAKKARYSLASATGTAAVLTALTEGQWGNGLSVNVAAADTNAQVTNEVHTGSAPPINLKYAPVVKSARNRISVHFIATGITQQFRVLYDGDPAPATGEVKIAAATGVLTFADTITASDTVTASYLVDKSKAAKVTLQLGLATEVYTVVDGQNLVDQITSAPSAWVTASPGTKPAELPAPTVPATAFAKFTGGDDGAATADYQSGLDPLLDVDAHIIVAAGQSNTQAGAALDAHCQKASTDVFKRDRIAVVGSNPAKTGSSPLTTTDIATYVDALLGNTVVSDRIVFVAPGILTTSAAALDQPVNPVLLPGSYTAAVIAGMLAGMPPHISLTNKTVAVQGLEVKFNNPQLTELVQNGVTALEIDRGIRVLRGQMSDSGAFREITTRRIVDYAKYGVRSAAGPYIGLLNNDRVRGALRATLNRFLQQMFNDEMLVAYELDVSATRDEQIAGIVRVIMTLQPVFSINFIRVTMILS
ncbi:Phage tail sheath protein [Rhizobiales bacterium GAS188]|nr:Phage tail sheath protein [Rhizobiales bacterium GAS188]